MTPEICPVILCGGSGTRLWPRSRKTKPKPFLPLIGSLTLFEETLNRTADTTLFTAPIVITGDVHLPHVVEQLPSGSEAQVIVEPQAKNTAAAIALAAHRLRSDTIMLVCPSDHYIADVAAFRSAALAAAELAAEGWLVSFGIEAKSPETGFGYIQRGSSLAKGYRVERFVEKPDLDRARQFLAEGTYSWNGGIFAFAAGRFIEELTRHRPRLAAAIAEAVSQGSSDAAGFHPDPAAFSEIESESVDYAVMENTDRAAMVPADMGWSDIGNWDALFQAQPACDADGNCVRGRGELVDCRSVFVDSDGPRVSVIGLENVVVVVDGDEILVTGVDGVQKVGKLSGAANQ